MSGTVTLDPEQVIKLAEDIESVAKRLRALGMDGFKSTAADLHNFDIAGISWNYKDKTTGKNRPANLEDGYAWAFAANQNGVVPPNQEPLVTYLKRFGKVQQNGYEITISKDGKFLSRKKL